MITDPNVPVEENTSIEGAEKRIYYKVVSMKKTRLTSWSLIAAYKPTIYGPGLESRPNEGWGPLAVFDAPYFATRFMQAHGCTYRDPDGYVGQLILKCEIDVSQETALFQPGSRRFTDVPIGTCLADCVRGIAILTPDELPAHMDELHKVRYREDYAEYLRAVEAEAEAEATGVAEEES